MKITLDLQMFSGGHDVTVRADDGFSAAAADETTDVAAETEVTISTTLETGYELAEYEVVTGGVTVDPATGKFEMGEADVVIVCKSKANNNFMVMENIYISLNGAAMELKKNSVVKYGLNGAIIGVEPMNGGTAIDLTSWQALIDNMIACGVLVKL